MTEPLDLAGLETLGRRLGRSLPPGAVVWLEGELGAGKTTLARALAAGRGAREAATSPTFTLAHRYDTGRGPIYHLDCYRFRRPDEAGALDWEAILRGDLVLIEWPERGGAWVPAPDLRITLTHLDDPDRRAVRLVPSEVVAP